MAEERICTGCGKSLSADCFYPSKPTTCKSCLRIYLREYRSRPESPVRRAKHRLKLRYGMSPKQYDDLLAAQGGGCAICGAPEPREWGSLHVDHDHSCCPGGPGARTCGECVRGLLCSSCNTGIGNLGDDPQRLIAAAAYLMAASESMNATREDFRAK